MTQSASRIPEQDEPAASFEDDNGNHPRRVHDQSPIFAKPTEAQQAAAVDALFDPTPVEPHALDTAPENSKIVVITVTLKKGERPVRRGVLATPDGEHLLPEGDLAHLLPVGAKVFRAGAADFRAVVPVPYQHCSNQGITAADVIRIATTRLTEDPAPQE